MPLSSPSDAETDPWLLPWQGGCRCGAVRLRVTEPPLLASACHCAGCQSMSSSAFSLTLTLPASGFAVTKGEPVPGGLTRDMHHFCPQCMTWMFTRISEMDLINLRPSMLDDHAWFEPFVEYCVSEALSWARTPAKHRFDKFREVADYQRLVEAYRTEGARPGWRGSTEDVASDGG